MNPTTTISADSVRVLFEKGTYFGNNPIFALPGKEAPGLQGYVSSPKMGDDIVVIGIMTLAFLMICLILNLSSSHITSQLKTFFQERERSNLFAEANNEFHYAPFLIGNTAVMWGLLLYYVLFIPLPYDLYLWPTWQLIVGCIGISIVFYLLKYFIYKWVNWTFFDKEKRERWMEIYSLLQSLLGLVLFPILCLLIFTGWPSVLIDKIILFATGFVEILLFYKSFSIFFAKFRGQVCNILYFCTLEIIPLLIIGKILVEIKHG